MMSVASGQEVGQRVEAPSVAFTTALSNSVTSVQEVLEGIRLRLLDEMRLQARASASMHIETSYEPIINSVFGVPPTIQTNDGFVSTGNSPSVCVSFTKSFDIGATDPEVVRIQQFLNTHSPETRVAQSGIGSIGNETNYYGSKTFLAVWAFQQRYKADILTPVGLVSPTGFWGESTRAKANMLLGCALP